MVLCHSCLLLFHYLYFIAFRNMIILLKIVKYLILKALQIIQLSVFCDYISFPPGYWCWLYACLQENFPHDFHCPWEPPCRMTVWQVSLLIITMAVASPSSLFFSLRDVFIVFEYDFIDFFLICEMVWCKVWRFL